MATRLIHANDAGEPYFKGEGYSFYLPRPNTTGLKVGDAVRVESVSCGQAGAMAIYVDAKGKRRSAVGE